MTMKIADDAESIRRRLEEIQAERMQQIMGKPIEEIGEAKAIAEVYLSGHSTFNLPNGGTLHDLYQQGASLYNNRSRVSGISPSVFNDHVRQYMIDCG